MGIIRITRVSKPLVIAAVILLFIGSSLGAILMLSIFGFPLTIPLDIVKYHRVLQIDGFLTLLIMGIGYMLIPRFRNINNPKPSQVYASFILLIASIALSLLEQDRLADITMLIAIAIFATYVFKIIRIKPKLLPMTDYYIVLAVISLIAINVFKLYNASVSLQYIQSWLLFPLFMILAVEYKTLPSFIGYVNPRANYTRLSLLLATISMVMGFVSIILDELAIIFSIMLLAMVITFDKAAYVTHGFDYSSIVSRLRGEELIRYRFTLLHIRLAYLFLYSSLILSIAYHILNSFALYDLSIHLFAIGFIGLTIKLYFPMMLPPIIGRTITFTRFNLLPLTLILLAIAFRIVGFIALEYNLKSDLMMIIAASGWLIIIALFLYARMIHKAMASSL